MTATVDQFNLLKFGVRITFLLLLLSLTKIDAYNAAKRWYNDFFYQSHAHPLIRPAESLEVPLIVYMNLSLSQIMEVNVKNQVLVLNVWIYQEWRDHRFKWNPKDYGMLSEVQIPSNMIWLPDLVLYNNAGGDWDFSGVSNSKVKIMYDGTIIWKPPFILKSQCDIDVTYFPFDIQECILKMGTWTHNGLVIDLRHFQQKQHDEDLMDRFDDCESSINYAVDLTEYMQSYEWDLLEVKAKRNIMKYPCCPEPYLDVTFTVKIRRMTLYYGLNLICPCLSISFMAILTFYLPTYCAEKMTLCISVFLALTIFILVVFDLTPSTSRSVPLIVKYLLFTMLMVTISIVASIIVLNISLRQPETNQLPLRFKKVLLGSFPKYLLLQPMEFDEDQNNADVHFTQEKQRRLTDFSIYDLTWTKWHRQYEGYCDISSQTQPEVDNGSNAENSINPNTSTQKPKQPINTKKVNALKRQLAMESLRSIHRHLKLKEMRGHIRDEWIFAGIVIDRFMLILYTAVVTFASVIVFLNPPPIWNQEKALASQDAERLLTFANYTRFCKNVFI